MKDLIMANDNDLVAKTKEEGLEHNITATGRRLGIAPVKGLALYRIGFVDGKQGGALPAKLSGMYTGHKTAQLDLSTFIAETWDLAAEATPKKRSA